MDGSILGNIAGSVYYLYFQLTGILLSFLVFGKRKLSFSVLTGSVFGSVLVSHVPCLFAYFFDFGFTAHLLAALLMLPIPVYFVVKFSSLKAKLCERVGEFIVEQEKNKGIVLVFLVMFAVWCYLLYTHNIKPENGTLHTGQSCFGDMNMHLGFVTSIANQKVFPPQYSLFPGTKLGYPFLSDSISSSVYLFGASLRYAYTFPMLFAFAQVFFGLTALMKTVLKKQSKTILALLFFFLNGGFGLFYFLSWSQEQKYTFSDIFNAYYKTPTNLTVENIRWVNVIADMLLPQRATLFGYAVVFCAIYVLYRACTEHDKKLFLFAGILGGSLPLIHTHSFLAFGLIAASFLLTELLQKANLNTGNLPAAVWSIFLAFMVGIEILNKKEILTENILMTICISVFAVIVFLGLWLLVHAFMQKQEESFDKDKEFYALDFLKTWGVFLVLMLALSLPQLIGFTFNQVSNSSNGFVKGYFNWGNQGEEYIWFYVKNIGIVLILGVLGSLKSKGNRLMFLISIISVNLLVDLVALGPNTYDNNKLLYITYAFVTIFAADLCVDIYELLAQKAEYKKTALALLGVIVICALCSGALTLVREWKSDYEIYGSDQMNLAKWVENNTEVSDIFVTSDRHNNEISSLCGRNIVCGWAGWLGTHGIDTTERYADIRTMYENPRAGIDIFRKYGVDYATVTPYEFSNYTVDEEAFNELFTLCFESGDYRIYAIDIN